MCVWLITSLASKVMMSTAYVYMSKVTALSLSINDVATKCRKTDMTLL